LLSCNGLYLTFKTHLTFRIDISSAEYFTLSGIRSHHW